MWETYCKSKPDRTITENSTNIPKIPVSAASVMVTNSYQLTGAPNRIFAHKLHQANTPSKICATVTPVAWTLIRYSAIHSLALVIVLLSPSSLMLYVQTGLILKQIYVYKCQSSITHHIMKAYRVWRHSSTYSTLHALNVQPHTPAAFYPGKKSAVPLEYEAGCSSELILKVWRSEKILPAVGIEPPDPHVVKPVV